MGKRAPKSGSKNKPETLVEAQTGLNLRQELFCQEYLKDLNATQAALRAGYSEDSAASIGSENLQKPEIAERIEALMGARLERTKIDGDYVLTSLKVVAERCLQRAPVMVRRGREFVQLKDEEGRDVWKFDAMGAGRALELLGKNLRLFIEKHEHSGPDGKPISVAANLSDEELEAAINRYMEKEIKNDQGTD